MQGRGVGVDALVYPFKYLKNREHTLDVDNDQVLYLIWVVLLHKLVELPTILIDKVSD